MRLQSMSLRLQLISPMLQQPSSRGGRPAIDEGSAVAFRIFPV